MSMPHGGIVRKDVTGPRSEFRESVSGVSGADVGGHVKNVTLHGDRGLVPLFTCLQLKDLLECPVCFNLMHPPIYQCGSGHTLCAECKDKVKNPCPVCRGALGNIRCLALERIAVALETPCSCQGCQECKLKHKNKCSLYNGPNDSRGCHFVSDLALPAKHVADENKVSTQDRCSFDSRYIPSNPQLFENTMRKLTGFNYIGRQFCLHFEALHLGGAPVYMTFLRFMGSEAEAEEFNYSLEVGGNGRKLTWQGVPRSIRLSSLQVRHSRDGLIIPKNMANLFSGDNKQERRLHIAGRVWKQ